MVTHACMLFRRQGSPACTAPVQQVDAQRPERGVSSQVTGVKEQEVSRTGRPLGSG